MKLETVTKCVHQGEKETPLIRDYGNCRECTPDETNKTCTIKRYFPYTIYIFDVLPREE